MSGLDLTEFYQTIKKTALNVLCENASEKDVSAMMRSVFETAESMAEDTLKKDELRHMDCREGCSICCRVNVAVLYPEAAAISVFLKANLTEAELAALKGRMKELLFHIKDLTEDERPFVHKECAFLNGSGGCSIYPVRPLLCRSVTSADVNACRDAISPSGLEEEAFIPMNISQKMIMDAAFRALAEAMDERGMNSASREITESVLELL